MSTNNLAERIHRILAADFSLGNRTQQTHHAVVVTNPEFPLVPESNLVHSIRLRHGMSVDELLAEVEPTLEAAGTSWRHLVEDPGTLPVDLGALLSARSFTASRQIGTAFLSSPSGSVNRQVEVRPISGKSSWSLLGELRRSIQVAAGRSGEELGQHASRTRRRSLSSNVRYYLALKDFEPVGHVGLLSVGRTGMLVDLAVRPDRRGMGIGRTLMRKMVEQSRSQGHDLTCLVHEDRPDLRRLASRMGFQPATQFVFHLAGGPRRERSGGSAASTSDPTPAQSETNPEAEASTPDTSKGRRRSEST